MNINARALDDELLSAWVDGELDGNGPERERLQSLLDTDADAASRARHWADDAQALRDAFGPMLTEPVPAVLSSLVWKRRVAPRWAMAAAAAGLLLTGGVIGALVAERLQPVETAVAGGWVSRAVYAHAVYTAEKRHPVEVRANEDHLSRWLSNRTEVPVRLVDLGPQGFQLLGGRLLPDGLGRGAQLMYQNAAGTRVTIYLRKAEPGSDHKLRYEQTGDLGLFHWVDEGIGCVIVGALPRADLERLAEEIYRQQEESAAKGPTS